MTHTADDAASGPAAEVRDVVLADGLVIRCLLSGDPAAPVLVLLHGLGEGSASWDEVAPRFAERFRVVALDLRGHGASGWRTTYSSELMRDDVVGVLDALGLGRVVLVGHSMGGVIAHLVTQARPDRVAALVVEDAPPRSPGRLARSPSDRPGRCPSTGRCCSPSWVTPTTGPCAGGPACPR